MWKNVKYFAKNELFALFFSLIIEAHLPFKNNIGVIEKKITKSNLFCEFYD